MLRDRIKESIKDAMREKNQRKRGTLRLIMAAVKDRDIAARVEDASEQDDDAVIGQILNKMIKQRRDSIKIYEEAGRLEMAEQEKQEVEIISEFLPTQMTDAEVEDACKAIITELGADSLKDIGRVMGALKEKYTGTMDFSKASGLVKSFLAG